MSESGTDIPGRTWGAKWAAAMVKAQGQFPTIAKTSDVEVIPQKGRAYSYSYAAFDLVIKKVQPVLEATGLAVIQDIWTEEYPTVDENGVQDAGIAVCVQTTVIHESGEYREYRPLIHRGFGLRIHDLGSLTSYLKRYAFLCALRLAPADEDDDGKNEMERPRIAAPAVNAEKPVNYETWKADITAVADEGTERLQQAWKTSAAALRNHAIKHDLQWWENCKQRAVASVVA